MKKIIQNLEDQTQSVLQESLVDDAAELTGIEKDVIDDAVKGLSFANYLELGNAIDIDDAETAKEILNITAQAETELPPTLDEEGNVVDFKQAEEDRRRRNWDATMKWGQQIGMLNPNDPLPEFDPSREEKCYICGSKSRYGHTPGCEFAPKDLPPKKGVHQLGEDDETYDYTQVCQSCSGLGIDPVGNTCKQCGGQGRTTLDGEYIDDESIYEADNPSKPAPATPTQPAVTPPSAGSSIQALAEPADTAQDTDNQEMQQGRKEIEDLAVGDEIEVADIDGEPAAGRIRNANGPGDTIIITGKGNEEHMIRKDSILSTPLMQVQEDEAILDLDEMKNNLEKALNEADAVSPLKVFRKVLQDAGVKAGRGYNDKNIGNRKLRIYTGGGLKNQSVEELERIVTNGMEDAGYSVRKVLVSFGRRDAAPRDWSQPRHSGRFGFEATMYPNVVVWLEGNPVSGRYQTELDEGTYKEYNDTQVALFNQIRKDLGKREVNYKNAEKLLKQIGWAHNNAVRASVDFMDWYQNEGMLNEVSPPGMEDWITKRKPEFKERYGDRWEEVLYATAWKRHNKNESIAESVRSTKYADMDYDEDVGLANDKKVKAIISKIKKNLDKFPGAEMDGIRVVRRVRGRDIKAQLGVDIEELYQEAWGHSERSWVDKHGTRDTYTLGYELPERQTRYTTMEDGEDRIDHNQIIDMITPYATADDMAEDLLPLIGYAFDDLEIEFDADMANKVLMDLGRDPIAENVGDKHQKKIAIDTVKNPSKALLGGPSAKEAETTLRDKFGYDDKKIAKLKEARAKINENYGEETHADMVEYWKSSLSQSIVQKGLFTQLYDAANRDIDELNAAIADQAESIADSYHGTGEGIGSSDQNHFIAHIGSSLGVEDIFGWNKKSVNEGLHFWVEPLANGIYEVRNDRGDIHDVYDDGQEARKVAAELNAEYGQIEEGTDESDYRCPICMGSGDATEPDYIDPDDTDKCSHCKGTGSLKGIFDEDISRIKELAGINEGYNDIFQAPKRRLKSGVFKSKAVGNTVKIVGPTDFEHDEHIGKIGVIQSARREPTFSQMRPFIIMYMVKFDDGDKVYVRRENVRKVKQIQESLNGERVAFRPRGVYPFTYDGDTHPLGKKISKQFPEGNRIEGTIIGIFEPGKTVDVRLDTPVRGTRNGRRQMIDVVTVPMNNLIETASGGATGAGAIASSPTALGGMQSRNRSIYGQTKLHKKPAPKKRPTREEAGEGIGRSKKE